MDRAVLARIAVSMPFKAVLAAFVLLSFTIYKKMNERSEKGEVLLTSLDRAIPFLPAFSVPYLLYLPALFWIVAYGIMASPYFVRIAASALAIQLAAAVVFRYHGTYVPRPAVTGRDVFSRLTSFIYANDKPFCAYPSLHVAYSVFCGYWAAVLFPAIAPAAAVFALAVVVSTLFLKQHALVDVTSGTVLAVLCLTIFR